MHKVSVRNFAKIVSTVCILQQKFFLNPPVQYNFQTEERSTMETVDYSNVK
jgi:hypothetical protein